MDVVFVKGCHTPDFGKHMAQIDVLNAKNAMLEIAKTNGTRGTNAVLSVLLVIFGFTL